MKNFMFLITILAVATGLWSCSSNDTTIGYAPAETINVAQSDFHAANVGDTVNTVVISSHEFSAYTNNDWITVSPAYSPGKKDTLTITIAPNKGDAREGSVIVWSGGSRDSIKISQDAGAEDIKAPLDGYKLVWDDEFSGSSLSSDWTYEVQPAGWVNNELQKYVQDNDVAQVKNGCLNINLMKDGNSIKSARLYAKKATGWTYGYIEARIKLPAGKGTWPAFWMMPVNFKSWPADGEIDIMEEVGYDPNVVVSTIHCNKYNNTGTATESARETVSTAQSDFHTYGLEWTADYMTFYVDGEKLLTYKNDGSGNDEWPFNKAFYPILNIAWGGTWGGAQGVDESALPAQMQVDYIRVFQKK
ncbi:MAG TPA: beta-glucanase [Prevotella sp.]|nr:beta-glucanase [Prevotella sp.]